MIFLIGLPKHHHSEILRLLVRSVKSEYITGIAFDSKMSPSEYFEECLETLSAFKHGRPNCLEKGLLVIGVTQPSESLQSVFRYFYPFALTKSIAFPERYSQSPSKIRREKNTIFRLIENEIKKQVKKKNLINSILGSRAARTPYLLPLKHFGEEDLDKMILDTWERMPDCENPVQLLDMKSKEFEKKFPFTKKQNAKTGLFANSRDIWFRPPGRALHGTAHSDSAGHRLTCYFNAALRIGGAIRPGFHYDCTRRGAKHSGTFEDCHDQSVTIAGNPHLNVYPNDFIR